MPAIRNKTVNTNKTTSSTTGLTYPACNEPIYEIHVRGHLDDTYSKWVDGLEVVLLENGETVLTGPIVDQSALMGVLNKLTRLCLTVISLNEVNTKNQKETK